MTLGVGEIGVFLPDDYVDILSEMGSYGVDENFVRNKSGFLKLPRISVGMSTSDLAVGAVRNLLKNSDMTPDQIECLVLCTQNPDGHGLPHTGSIVHHKLDLPEQTAVFDLSLGCSGYVYGLSIITSFMSSHGMKNGVLVTSDPYSKIVNKYDRNTGLLFGDGATATRITASPSFRVGLSSFCSAGKDGHAISVDDNGMLQMNGRAVFNFAATKVPKMIEGLLSNSALSKGDVDLFLLHQGSKYIVDSIADRLHIPREKVPFWAKDTGNTVSSSIPFMLSGIKKPSAKTILIAGFGVGLSWAASVLYSNEELCND